MDLRFLSMSQLAELTGLDRRTVKDRLKDLKAQSGKGRGHYYDTQEALPRLYFPEGSNNVEEQMAEAQLRKARADAEKAEIDVKVKRGELVAIEEVAEVVGKEYTYVRARILAMPTRLAKPLSMESDPLVVKKLLDEAVTEALEDLAADQKFEEGGYVESSSEIEADAAEGPEGPTEA
jgi:DNA-binding Lrp family transcriptional regulator